MFRASFRPDANLTFRAQRSPGGLGSLGRRRFTAVETRKGGRSAREAKALVPSALYWLREQDGMPSQTATLLQHAIRVPDPYFQVHDQWLIRQLAPDIAKIDMPRERDKRLGLAADLLRLMGRETANIHLGSRTSEDSRIGSAASIGTASGFRRRPIGWWPALERTMRSGLKRVSYPVRQFWKCIQAHADDCDQYRKNDQGERGRRQQTRRSAAEPSHVVPAWVWFRPRVRG